MFAVLLFTAFSCGGAAEEEAQLPPSDESVEESAADTLTDKTPVLVEGEEDPPEIAEVIAAAGPEGTWNTTMGEMELIVEQSGTVTGSYPLGSLEGILTDNVLQFTYSESSLTGGGTFTFDGDFNSFTGVQDISGTELVWDGSRL